MRCGLRSTRRGAMTDELYKSEVFTAPGGFTSGIEGPSCDRAGNLYAVNYDR